MFRIKLSDRHSLRVASHRPAGYTALFFFALIFPALYVVSRSNYNLFHSLADIFTIIIASTIFVVAWNSRESIDNNYFLYAGIGFLSFAFLDLFHVLGNKDMGVFPQYGNLGPALYIASRYVLSISLLTAPLFINRKLRVTPVFVAYSLVTLLVLLSVFYWKNFPACFVEGVGLTTFKVMSDYIICLILLGALALLFLNRRAFDARVLRLLAGSILFSIASGLAFTLYADPFGVLNAVGHFFQIISFYLIYLAVIETGLIKPQDILFRKLKQSEEKYRHLVEHAPTGIFEIDFTENRFKTVNETACNLLGFTEAEILTMKPTDLLDPDSREIFLDRLRKAQGGEAISEEIEYKGKRKDGSKIWGSLHTKFQYRDRRIVGAFVVAHDITERKQAEEALRTSKDSYAALYSSMTEGVAQHETIYDTGGQAIDYILLDVNPAYERITGLRRNKVIGKKASEIYGVGQAPFLDLYSRVASTGQAIMFETYFSPMKKHFEISVFSPGKGKFATVFQDITPRKLTEEALRENEERFRVIASSTPDHVFVQDQDLRYKLVVNPQLGQTEKDMLGKTDFDILSKEDADKLTRIKRQVLETGKPIHLEIPLSSKEGDQQFFRGSYVPKFDVKGQTDGLIGYFQNVTEERRMREEVSRSRDELEIRVQERTEELAKSQERLRQLASQLLLAQEKERKRVAVDLHDGLLSELAAVKMLFEAKVKLLEQGKLSDLSEFKKVSDILALVMREARGIMNNLHPSVLDELGLIPAINWLTGEYERSYPHIRVQKKFEVSAQDIAESVGIVIFRVLQEALNNFAKHGRGDRVELSLSRTDGTFSFTIQDNGQGFDVENAQKGLGLDSMRERVEISGGEFQIESILGQGTTLRAIWGI